MFHFDKSNHGFSLIEVLIASVILGIVSAGMMTLMSHQQRALLGVEQKHDLLSLRSAIQQQFTTNEACTWQTKDLEFNASGITATKSNAASLSLQDNSIYGGNSSNKILLAKEGERAGINANSPLLSRIRLTNFLKADDDSYISSIVISTDPSTTVMVYKDVVIPGIQVRTDPTTPINKKKILGCGAGDKKSLYPNWPDRLNCGNTVWHIRSEGQYNCFRGGEKTTRSALISFDPNTRRVTYQNNQTDDGGPSERCLCGECCSKTMDMLIEEGKAN